MPNQNKKNSNDLNWTWISREPFNLPLVLPKNRYKSKKKSRKRWPTTFKPVSCLRHAPICHQKRGQPAHHRHAQCRRRWWWVDTAAGQKNQNSTIRLVQKALPRSARQRPEKESLPPSALPARREGQSDRKKRWATSMSLFKKIWKQQKKHNLVKQQRT